MSSTCRSRRRGPEPMDGSADRPAVAFEDFVDDLDPDRGYRGITRDAMIAWMRVAYELSDGAARAELKQALVSGKVKIFATRDGRDGWEENIFECRYYQVLSGKIPVFNTKILLCNVLYGSNKNIKQIYLQLRL